MDITGLGSVADFASGIMDRFWPKKMTDEERATLQTNLANAIEERDMKRDVVKAEVMKAELSQGDAYTKRARPTVVYMGLLFIFLVHVLFPMITFFTGVASEKPIVFPTLTLPSEFWYTWGGVCSVWMIGRTMERRGAANSIVKTITGIK